jgi:hypothetical protein
MEDTLRGERVIVWRYEHLLDYNSLGRVRRGVMEGTEYDTIRETRAMRTDPFSVYSSHRVNLEESPRSSDEAWCMASSLCSMHPRLRAMSPDLEECMWTDY